MDSGRPFRIASPDTNRSRPIARPVVKQPSERPAPVEKPSEPAQRRSTDSFDDPIAPEVLEDMPKAPRVRIGLPKWRPRKLHVTFLAAILVTGVVLTGIFMAVPWLMAGSGLPGADAYQAVTTTDGQIYFGKVKPAGSEYIEITDGYYLQPTADTPDGQPNTGKLVRLSNRLYAPKGSIVIAKRQILSFEPLDPDGQIVQMIGKGN